MSLTDKAGSTEREREEEGEGREREWKVERIKGQKKKSAVLGNERALIVTTDLGSLCDSCTACFFTKVNECFPFNRSQTWRE